MDEAGFTGYADELAETLGAAREAAAACEALLERARGRFAADEERWLLATLAAPAAIAQVLLELVDRPPAFLLACAQACSDASLQAAGELGERELPLDTDGTVETLRTCSEACRRLLDAALL